MKKIGIAIPTYNRLVYLEKLVSTIPENVNIGISDNGAYLKNLSKWANAKIIQHEDVIPVFDNWNSALDVLGDCDVLAIPSDDDFYIDNAFNIINKYINKYDCDIYIFGCNTIDENDNIINSYLPDNLECLMPVEGLKNNFFHIKARMPAIFFKKSFLEKIGFFDTDSFKLTAADSELIQRALILGKSLYVPEVIANYRMWSGNLTNKTIASDLWFVEVKNWTRKIKALSAKKYENKFKADWYRYEDEILALNILASLAILRKNKENEKLLAHYKKRGIPKKARLITKLRIIKQVLMSKVEGIRSV